MPKVVSGQKIVRIREVPRREEEEIGGVNGEGCNGVNNANPLHSRTLTE